MIQTDGGGDDGIGGGEDPAQDGNEVHAIEDHAVTDGETLVLADIGDTGAGGEIMAFAAVVKHGESIIMAFHKGGDDGSDPAYEGDKGQDKDRDRIYRLPEGIADGEPDAAPAVEQELPVEPEMEILAVDERFGLLAEIGEQRRADDQKEIFEKRKIKEDQDEVDHDAAHQEEEAEDRALAVMQETVDADDLAKPGHGGAGRLPEKIHADAEQDRIEDSRNDDPLP